MNDTKPLIRPDVVAFVADVRARLSDLSDDERDDLLGGLEADLEEKVADGAPLGDPASYAAELRAAAGLPDRTRRLPRPSVPGPHTVERWIDGARGRFFSTVESHQHLAAAWLLVSVLRPAWWVARAWVAVTWLDVMLGPWEPISMVPSFNAPVIGWLLLGVAIVISTLIGLGRLWPGSGPGRRLSVRLVLLGLNAFAIVAPFAWGVASPGYLVGTPDPYGSYEQGYRDGMRAPGLHSWGRNVTNVFAYDAAGNPIDEFQLFDQAGRRVGAEVDGTCPWTVGGRSALNVFPRAQHPAHTKCSDGEGLAVNPPFVSVPPVDGSEPTQDTTSPSDHTKKTDGAQRDGKRDGKKKQRDQKTGKN